MYVWCSGYSLVKTMMEKPKNGVSLDSGDRIFISGVGVGFGS